MITIEKRIESLITQMKQLSAKKERILLAIDGRCCAGKTTLAQQLQQELACEVLHMDDFFLRPEQRTKERYAQPGGNVDYERFIKEVLRPLQAGEAYNYQPFSCKTMQLEESIRKEPKKITVIEGAYSCHPQLREAYDLRVFLTVNKQEQIARIRKRNGEERLSMFVEKWIPLEENYIHAYDVEKACAVVLDTSQC